MGAGYSTINEGKNFDDPMFLFALLLRKIREIISVYFLSIPIYSNYMSLVSYASAWTNNDDDDTIIMKKKTPSLRKTMKRPSKMTEDSVSDVVENLAIEDTMLEQDARNNRVSTLLNKLTAENDGNVLADFRPLANPIINKKTDDENAHGRQSDVPLSYQANPLQIHPPSIRRDVESNYLPNLPDLGNSFDSYQRTYEPPKIIQNARSMPDASSSEKKIMEKINYMIHLLEQQHNEKTSNITEEFILYTFLGVFIIFIVDSFARVGKYVR